MLEEWPVPASSSERQKTVSARILHSISPHLRVFLGLFILTLPLANPWVRGDGVGYYAYIHALLIRQDLHFETEWRAGNSTFIKGRLDGNGDLTAGQYTRTGYVANHWSIGPSILWAPFLAPVHLVMLGLRRAGAPVDPDGFSKPYTVTMGVVTVLYGFIGLLLCYKLACRHVEERWAFLATLGIWFASSLPVYMYFNPSWSHAHSVFSVALFLWFWDRTRPDRTLGQWIILGLLSGLMLNVYYPNAALLLVPLFESLSRYWRRWRAPERDLGALGRLFTANLVYLLITVTAFLPTLITRYIIYGHPLVFGYEEAWRWKSPMLLAVLFSADHGMLTWTPILIPALLGLFLFWKYDRQFAAYLVAAFLAFYYLISSHTDWDGLASFGNRFFISLTPLFILGLSVFLNEAARRVKSARTVAAAAIPVMCLLVLWNWAFIFQWGTHLVPARGPISWSQMVSNQVTVVPRQVFGKVSFYFGNRGAMMQTIEQEDVKQLESHAHKASEN
jgi:hypothetical protein